MEPAPEKVNSAKSVNENTPDQGERGKFYRKYRECQKKAFTLFNF